ncbi:MAG: imidazole glycerol phosphate synthase subunit HisH [Saprospiraceae bacterium]
MIGIIDYGSGNINAIATIYKNLNIECVIVSNPNDLDSADKLILPGVGSFDETMRHMLNSGLKSKLDELVLVRKTPILGICVGMQILSNSSEEGSLNGLGWINGKVKKFEKEWFQTKPHIPHMGWNQITPRKSTPLFDNLDDELGFYFVHSYYFDCEDSDDTLAITDYGITFSSAVSKANIYGVQFHPEKSHGNGVNLLKNFAIL